MEFPFNVKAILPIGVDVRVARRREMHHIGIIESLSLNRQAIFSMPDFSLAVLVPAGYSVSDDRFRLDLPSVPSTWNGSDLTDRILRRLRSTSVSRTAPLDVGCDGVVKRKS
jgi:hypothetical protein